MNAEFLSERPKYDRSDALRQKPSRVQRDGGFYGAGLIEGVSIITEGEALGHEAWIDSVFAQQVADGLNATEKGVKSRFTHPSLSGDGMGTVLGRIMNARVAGEQILGDLHLNKSSHEAPDGDLGKYVMDLADEDDSAFGLSIVFEHDEESEREFYGSNLEEFEYQDRQGEKKKGKRFKSPDSRNTKQLYHVRLKELRASDVVDDPAANPKGLFYRGQDIPVEADKVLAFALGVSNEKPVTQFGVDPDRLKGFVTRSLAAHGLEIRKKEEPMSETTTAPVTDTPTPETAKTEFSREDLLSEMGTYTAAFGAEKGVAWFSEGKPLVDCWRETATDLREQLAAAQKEIEGLKAKSDPARGETSPIRFSTAGKNGDGSKPAPVIRIAGRG